MKKFLLLLICCFTLIGLTGCSVQGTWKFEEKTAEAFGIQKTYKIGDKDALGKEITEDYLVIEFNKDGTIKNYESILSKYYKKYQNAKTQDAQDKAKEKYDDLKELLDNYETLILETIPGWEAEVREKIDEKYENMVHQFEYEIEMRVNWGDSVREVREFFHEISDYSEDFKNIASFNFDQATSYFDSNEITSRTRQLSDALGELDKINAANAAGITPAFNDTINIFAI